MQRKGEPWLPPGGVPQPGGRFGPVCTRRPAARGPPVPQAGDTRLSRPLWPPLRDRRRSGTFTRARGPQLPATRRAISKPRNSTSLEFHPPVPQRHNWRSRQSNPDPGRHKPLPFKSPVAAAEDFPPRSSLREVRHFTHLDARSINQHERRGALPRQPSRCFFPKKNKEKNFMVWAMVHCTGGLPKFDFGSS